MSRAEQSEWAAAAKPLGLFVDRHLVNRRDVWGAYYALERRQKDKPSTYTAPRLSRRGADTLEAWRVSRHFAGASPGHVIGLHSTSDGDLSRWGAFDFDVHGPKPPEFVARLLSAALTIAERIVDVGGAPLLEDSNGAGGLHLWTRFDAPVPTADCFAWIDGLARTARSAFDVPVETYPKQASAVGQFGNWLRLPGRHHTRDHWSRIAMPGGPWLRGGAAVDAILAWPTTPAAVVPVVPKAPPMVRVARPPVQLPARRAPSIAQFMSALPHGDEGSGRSDRLFKFARFLRNKMQCSDEEALALMEAWNDRNCPPLPDAKVRDTWENSGRYNSRHRPVQEAA